MASKRQGVDRRLEILAYMKVYHAEYGISPSIGEIAEELRTQKSSIHHHLLILEKEGHVKHLPGRARSWLVLV